MPATITGLDFVCIPASDLARATAFYRDAVGLTPGESTEGEFVEFDLPDGNTLSVISNKAYLQPGEADRLPSKTGNVVLAVDDIEAARVMMAERGLTQMDAAGDSPFCNMVFGHDTEGNGLVFHRRKNNPGAKGALDFVQIPIADMTRAKAFYKEVFGLVPGEFDNDEGFVEFDVPGNTALVLGDPKAMGLEFEPVTGGAVAIGVADIDAAFALFKAKGLAEGDVPFETPVCFMGPVKDSEGNSLLLHKLK